ncbi:MAG: MFS transporter, partial [Pseudomonadota bacterium]
MAVSESVYELLTNEDDARHCTEIGDEACREAPMSFTYMLLSYCFTKFGDTIVNPKTTLAWLASLVGAPAFVVGLIVPIRESGSMIPQSIIGGFIRRLPVRKWVWVVGSLGQSLCIFSLGLVALYLSGHVAGWSIVGLIAAFSLFRGLCSIAAKDVLGKTIPKPKRGQLTGWSASVAGFLSIGVGATLLASFGAELDSGHLAGLMFVAAALWLLGAAMFSRISEHAGAVDGGSTAIEGIRRLRIVFTDKPFRQFVFTRALLMCSALSAPFYVVAAQQLPGADARLLGAFIIAAGVASLVS